MLNIFEPIDFLGPFKLLFYLFVGPYLAVLVVKPALSVSWLLIATRVLLLNMSHIFVLVHICSCNMYSKYKDFIHFPFYINIFKKWKILILSILHHFATSFLLFYLIPIVYKWDIDLILVISILNFYISIIAKIEYITTS